MGEQGSAPATVEGCATSGLGAAAPPGLETLPPNMLCLAPPLRRSHPQPGMCAAAVTATRTPVGRLTHNPGPTTTRSRDHQLGQMQGTSHRCQRWTTQRGHSPGVRRCGG
ncbi:MAG: hypothetical protein WDW36_004709 [Sanguina aurantia]